MSVDVIFSVDGFNGLTPREQGRANWPWNCSNAHLAPSRKGSFSLHAHDAAIASKPVLHRRYRKPRLKPGNDERGLHSSMPFAALV